MSLKIHISKYNRDGQLLGVTQEGRGLSKADACGRGIDGKCGRPQNLLQNQNEENLLRKKGLIIDDNLHVTVQITK